MSSFNPPYVKPPGQDNEDISWAVSERNGEYVAQVVEGGDVLSEDGPHWSMLAAENRARKLAEIERGRRADGLSCAIDPRPNKGWIAQVIEDDEVISESETFYTDRYDAWRKAEKMLMLERYDRVQLMLPIGEPE